MITGKITQEVWFDNRMAKPPQIDQLSNVSVLVFFEVRCEKFNLEEVTEALKIGGFYCGQYDFASQEWHIIPGGLKGIKDRDVIKWMHIPEGAVYTSK
jgi:hypothetical protein